MSNSSISIEMTSLSPTTPLLYQNIIEENESTTEARSSNANKASVQIETPLEVGAEKVTAMTDTKYVLRNGILLWSNLSVEDEWGHELYHIDTSGFFYIEMKVKDVRTGFTAVTMKQRSLFLPNYDIFLGGDETRYAKVAMKWTWTGLNASIKFENGEPDIFLRASFTGRRYTFHRGDVLVASAKRGWCKHEYTIAAGENIVFFHSLIAAVDKILTATRRKAINL